LAIFAKKTRKKTFLNREMAILLLFEALDLFTIIVYLSLSCHYFEAFFIAVSRKDLIQWSKK